MHPGIGAVPAHSTGHSAQQWKQSSDGIWEETWQFKVLEEDIFLDQDLKGLAASRLFSGCFGNIVARHPQCHIAWIYLTKRAKPLSRKYQWHWICHIKETINYLMSCLWGVQQDKQGDSFFMDCGHQGTRHRFVYMASLIVGEGDQTNWSLILPHPPLRLMLPAPWYEYNWCFDWCLVLWMSVERIHYCGVHKQCSVQRKKQNRSWKYSIWPKYK